MPKLAACDTTVLRVRLDDRSLIPVPWRSIAVGRDASRVIVMLNRRSRPLFVACGALAGASTFGAAWSAESDKPPPDKSAYSLFNPTPDGDLRTFTPDRPARSSNPFTIDAGRLQIESDFANYTYENDRRARTKTLQAADPVLKLGITSSMDFEVAFGGFNDIRTTDSRTGETLSKGRGFGDVTLTAKFNILGNDGGDYAFALLPYLIVPSGTRNVSSGQVEGGLIAPLTVNLPQDFSITLQTEVDALANENGPGTHANIVDIINVSHAVPGLKDLTATAELYSSLSLEPHTADEYTFDVALGYLVEPNTQLDVGANLGLNRGAPAYQVYSGIAHRF